MEKLVLYFKSDHFNYTNLEYFMCYISDLLQMEIIKDYFYVLKLQNACLRQTSKCFFEPLDHFKPKKTVVFIPEPFISKSCNKY